MWLYNYDTTIHTDELYHHGVKGMKWGVIKKKVKNTMKKNSIPYNELSKQDKTKRKLKASFENAGASVLLQVFLNKKLYDRPFDKNFVKRAAVYSGGSFVATYLGYEVKDLKSRIQNKNSKEN